MSVKHYCDICEVEVVQSYIGTTTAETVVNREKSSKRVAIQVDVGFGVLANPTAGDLCIHCWRDALRTAFGPFAGALGEEGE